MWRSSCSRSQGSAILTRPSSGRASAASTRRNLTSASRRTSKAACANTIRPTWSVASPVLQLARRTRFSTPRITIISASIPTRKATTFTTGLPTTAPAAAFCWNWRVPLRNRRSARRTPCTLPRLPRKSRDCSARSILASIRRSRRATSRSISTTTCCCPSAFRAR